MLVSRSRFIELESKYKNLEDRYNEVVSRYTELEVKFSSKVEEGVREISESFKSEREELDKERDDLRDKWRSEKDKFLKESEDLLERSQVIEEKESKLDTLESRISKAKEELKGYNHLINQGKDMASFEEVALFEPRYPEEMAASLLLRLKDCRSFQKEMIKGDEAVLGDKGWTVGGSKVEGKKMINRIIKLALRAFNGESAALIQGVKWDSVDSVSSRIERAYEQINKLIETNLLYINKNYLHLKIEELYLVHEHAERVKEEKDEQKAIKEKMKQDAAEEKALLAELAKVEKEEEIRKNAYEKAEKEFEAKRHELEHTSSEERRELEEQLEEARAALEEAREKKERTKSMAEQTRSGFVYIVSNIGSFGPEIFKVGMTRRLNPDDRIRELSGASVPFQFDVHAMIQTDDAPALENALHRALDDNRVNKVNKRKEFFKTSLEELEGLVEDLGHGAFFRRTLMAKDYYETLSIEGKCL